MTLILNEQITRANVPIPDQQVSEIIKATPEKSVVLNRARKARLSTKVAKQPVLSALPEAYWPMRSAIMSSTETIAASPSAPRSTSTMRSRSAMPSSSTWQLLA